MGLVGETTRPQPYLLWGIGFNAEVKPTPILLPINILEDFTKPLLA